VAVVVLVLSGAYWVHARWIGGSTPAPDTRSRLRVVPLVDPDPCPAESHAGRPGYVGYRLPAEDQLLGLESAWVFPERDGAPTFVGGAEVTACQMPGGLDLRPWVAERRPGGPHWLFFALRVAREDDVVSWRGWSRFEASDLGHESLWIVPREGSHVEIRVRTVEDHPVPGALVSIDPQPLGPGRIPHLLHTDEEGRRILCGLDPDLPMTARLVEGVGPLTLPVSASFTADVEVVRLGVELRGRWRFTRHVARLPLAGASSRLTEIAGSEGRMPRVWPVSRWLGPGRGPDTPFYVMYRASASSGGPLPLRLHFDGYPPVDLEDARSATRLEFQAAPRRIATGPAG
jgi:hypothetical protein